MALGPTLPVDSENIRIDNHDLQVLKTALINAGINSGGSGAPALVTSPAPSPATPQGALWFDNVGLQLYVAYNNTWVVSVNQSGYVIDAVSDGSYYGRHNAAWAKVLAATSPVFATMPVNAANDAAAATAGVAVGGIYRNGSVLMVRVV